MIEAYNLRYYTLNQIPQYRHDYITLRLNWFIELLDLKDTDWPIDCIELLKKLKVTQLIPFQYGFSEMPGKYDAITQYIPEHGIYIMLINNNKVKYPFQHSHDRRLNFTIAHELAHIALEHLLIPREAKSLEEITLEETEADELAGRLLMPEKLLFSSNFYSLTSVAEYYNVSKTALWKRLNNIKRLDLLHSKRIETCSCCGNTKFSMFAEFCGICGTPLSAGLNGIRKAIYPTEIPLDKYKSVIECPVCKSTHFNSEKCAVCGTYIFNFCSDYFVNGEEGCSYANLGNSRFCEICGKPTYFYIRGLLNTWKDIINGNESYINL